MQRSAQQDSTCPNCGGVLEKTPSGELGCMSCLLRAGIGSEEETVHDSTLNASEDRERFGVYEIDRREDGSLYELGRGAMGVTYRATDTSLQRKVALKIIKTDIAERSADARERFIREARAAAALRHENIATVYQFGIRLETGQYFYAMELLEGETLDERVRRAGPLDARTTIQIAQQVTSALAAAERQGLVHRDLKPANLMLVSPDGETSNNKKLLVKIIDFGLAKAVQNQIDPKSLTHDKFVGTPAFASPEQFEHSALDVRSDIYSLGETLWFALTGKTPFSGRTVEEIHRAQKSNVLPIEQLKVAHVPSRLRSLLELMLAFEPASRPGTGDLAARLKRCFPEARTAGHTRVALVSACILILGATGFFAFRLIHTENLNSNPSASDKSIAVLPFENLTDEKENAYFADGVEDEIRTNLAKVADLKVISRTSVMQYKNNAEHNVREIAKALGVAHVLEGSVQRAGNRIRVTAQLIDARTDAHLWAEHYDRNLADLFGIESELAEQIVSQLKLKLSPKEEAAINEQPTSDLVAHDLYLRAKLLIEKAVFNEPKDSMLLEAIQLLNEAVARDPSFVLAYCQLAHAHDQMYLLEFDHTQDRLDLANAAIQSINQLRPGSGEAHLALAKHLYWGYRDYGRARQALDVARRVLPNDPLPFLLKGYIDRREGRWDQATHNMERAVELDPQNFFTLQQIALTYTVLRRYADVAAILDRAVALAPKDVSVRVQRAAIDIDWRADTRPLHSTIEAIIASEPAAIERVAHQWLVLALWERDSSAINRALSLVDANGCHEDLPFPRAWCEGRVALLCGEVAPAREAFSRARKEIEAAVNQQSDYAQALCALGMVDAVLGNKEDAIREGRRAVELLPVTQDSIDGAQLVQYLAMIYGWVGYKDFALEQLRIASSIPGYLSYGSLRLDPLWDPLRGEPEFERIVASLAPKR
jgi:serine/threonine-protein kinase